ncbi:glycosyltransferase family 2 protein [Paenibacillus sp. Root444D2]|uniref:glycosyltransferase family 2 protein n=1 Tax=Paenibacillus sp. Root444D2 TaxID=1736538 RepID=UPI00070B5473|nr:glycosyltransferase family 2 protein [Paenibacillus sp. Root444D2]KQX51920.1 glycosyl transferase family 2 [Paenibacillus sp. Root444D2]
MKILVIIPAYNEEANIGQLLKDLEDCHVNNKKIDLLVINDCSKDRTSEICALNKIKVIDLPCNLGIGGAMQTGYKFAYNNNYDFAIQVDGDGQHNPSFIKDVLEPLISEAADLVIGSRYLNKEGFQSTQLRRIGIRYFSKLIQILVNQKVTDPTSGFRASNKKVIKLFAHKYPVDYPEPESIVYLSRIGMRILEVPVIMKHRVGGESSIKSFGSLYYMIKVSLAIMLDILRKPNSFVEKEVTE